MRIVAVSTLKEFWGRPGRRDAEQPLRAWVHIVKAVTRRGEIQLRGAQVSPDGKRVVYSALGSLYLKDLPHGTPRRLTQQTEAFESAPSWARDGSSLVYVTCPLTTVLLRKLGSSLSKEDFFPGFKMR